MASIVTKDQFGFVQSAVTFDAVSIVEIAADTDITEHPVETGAAVTDHVRPNLPTISVTAYVSNTPLPSNIGGDDLFVAEKFELPKSGMRPVSGLEGVATPTGSDQSVFGGAIGALFGGDETYSMYGAVPRDGADFNRAKAAIEALEKLRAESKIVTFVDQLSEYANVVISSVSATRALDDGRGATFQVTLKQLRIVSSQTVEAPLPAEVRGLASAAKGSQSTQEDKNSQLKSLAASGWDSIFGG